MKYMPIARYSCGHVVDFERDEGYCSNGNCCSDLSFDEIKRLMREPVADEREACAKIADEEARFYSERMDGSREEVAARIAKRIRERGTE